MGQVRETMLVESDERRALREAVGKLVGSYGRSYFQDVTRREVPPDELWRDMGRSGFLGVHLPEEYGGGGGGLVDLALVIEETASQGCPGSARARRRSRSRSPSRTPARTPTTSPPPRTPMATAGKLRGQKYWTSGIDEGDAVLVVARGAGRVARKSVV